MGTQFVRAEMYGKAASKIKANNAGARSFSASDVAAEQMRVEGHIGHVAEPGPPTLIFGIDPRDAVAAAEASFDAEPKTIVKTKAGPRERALRADTPIVLVGVASWPDSVEDMAHGDPDRVKLFEEWKAQNLLWLRKRYGSDLRSVVLHEDEAHPHLHFVVACDRAIETKKHDHLRGRGSKTDAKQAGRDFQNDYYEGVAVRCGLARMGPKRQRLKSRAEWLGQKASNQTLGLELLQLGQQQRDMEQAEVEAEAVFDSAWQRGQKLIADAMTMARNIIAEAEAKAGELLKAATSEVKRMRDERKALLATLRQANAEVDQTMQGLRAEGLPESKARALDKRTVTHKVLDAIDDRKAAKKTKL